MKLEHLNLTTSLTEIKMSPSAIQSMATKIPDVKVGIEFELIINDFGDDGIIEHDPEPDYGPNEPIDAFSENSFRRAIMEFFSDGDYNSHREVKSALARANRNYEKWKALEWIKFINEQYGEWHREEYPDEQWEDEETPNPHILSREFPHLDEFEQDNYSLFEGEEGSIESWLADEDIEWFDTFGERYDLTWPYWETPDEETTANPIGIGKRDCVDIADSFSDATNMAVKICKKYHGCGNPPAHSYIMEPDSSLKPDKDIDFGWEFKTAPLSLTDAIEQLKRVKAWSMADNAYTNESCGLHINVSLPNYDLNNLDYIKLVLFLGDEWVSAQFGRLGSTFAKSAMSAIKTRVAGRPDEVLINSMKNLRQGLNHVASKLIHSGVTEKMISINTHDNRIEFRSPGGNWLEMDLDKVISVIMRMAVALDIAMDPEREKREYSTKLYKILSSNGPDDRLKLFSAYSTGLIPKNELLKQWAEHISAIVPRSAKTAPYAADIMKRVKTFNIVDRAIGYIYGTVDALDKTTALNKVLTNPEKYRVDGVLPDLWELQEVPEAVSESDESTDNEQYFMKGGCYQFALYLHEVTKLPLYGLADDFGLLHHAFVLNPKTSIAIDARGDMSMENIAVYNKRIAAGQRIVPVDMKTIEQYNHGPLTDEQFEECDEYARSHDMLAQILDQ